MGNITEARERIIEAKLKLLSEQKSGDVEPVRLDLSYFDLSSKDLKKLLPIVNDKLPTISKLKLSGNKLTTLPANIELLTGLTSLELDSNQLIRIPASIASLTELTSLYLSQNQLTSLPADIGTLAKLVLLHLDSNQLTSLPQRMGDLISLSSLSLARNQLITLPESFSNLPATLVSINLHYNPLSLETVGWFNHHFPNNGGGIGHDPVAVIDQVYNTPEEKVVFDDLLVQLEDISFAVGDPLINRTGKEILDSFLSKVEITNEFSRDVYVPTVRNLLNSVLETNRSDNKEERDTLLVSIGTTIGDCATPVKAYLLPIYIRDKISETGKVTALVKALITREALAKEIQKELGPFLSASDKIEQVQGLLNSVFLEGAENDNENRLHIFGKRTRLPSTTGYPIFAYAQATDELVDAFKAKFCTLNEVDETFELKEGVLEDLFNKNKSNYLDNTIVDAYVNDFKAKFEALPSYKAFYIEHTLKDEDAHILNLDNLKGHLRARLDATTQDDYKATFDNFVLVVDAQLAALITNYKAPENTETKPDLANLAIAPTRSRVQANLRPNTEASTSNRNSPRQRR